MNSEIITKINELLDSYIVMSELTEEHFEKLGKTDYPYTEEEYAFRLFCINKKKIYANYDLLEIYTNKNTIKLLISEGNLNFQDADSHYHLQDFNKQFSKLGSPGVRRVTFYLKDVEELAKLLEGLEKYGYILQRT